MVENPQPIIDTCLAVSDMDCRKLKYIFLPVDYDVLCFLRQKMAYAASIHGVFFGDINTHRPDGTQVCFPNKLFHDILVQYDVGEKK